MAQPRMLQRVSDNSRIANNRQTGEQQPGSGTGKGKRTFMRRILDISRGITTSRIGTTINWTGAFIHELILQTRCADESRV